MIQNLITAEFLIESFAATTSLTLMKTILISMIILIKGLMKVLFSFSVCGDNRPADDYLAQPEVFLKLLELIKGRDISFHMTVGDIINGGTNNSEIVKRQFSDYLDAVKILPLSIFNSQSPFFCWLSMNH